MNDLIVRYKEQQTEIFIRETALNRSSSEDAWAVRSFGEMTADASLLRAQRTELLFIFLSERQTDAGVKPISCLLHRAGIFYGL